MRDSEIIEAFHEPAFAPFVVFARVLRVKGSREGREGGEGWSVVPTQAPKRKEALREPPFPLGKDRFHSVPIFHWNEWDRVESLSLPTSGWSYV